MGGYEALSEAGRQYATAHAAQYMTKDLHEALQLYQDLVAAHPDAEEAEYSRTQILNIVRDVVPKQELLDAQAGLARVHLEQGGSPAAGVI